MSTVALCLLTFWLQTLQSTPDAGPARTPYLDLVRARQAAEGSVLAGTAGLHPHLGPQDRGWGEPTRGGDGMGMVDLTNKFPTLRLQVAGDEKAVEIVARAVASERDLRVVWDQHTLGTAKLDARWQAYRFALNASEAKPGEHLLHLGLGTAGAALPASAQATAANTLAQLHSVHLLLESTDGAGAPAFNGRRDDPDILWLQGGERVRYYFPLAAGSQLNVAGVEQRGTQPPAQVVLMARGEQGEARELATMRPGQPATVDLSAFGPETITRIDFVAAAGQGEIGLRAPIIAAPDSQNPQGVASWKKPKNVILYIIDTLRGDRVSYVNPQSPVKTPRLDGFASDGVSFANAMVQGNYSKSTGCSLFSSTYNDVHHCHSLSYTLPRNIKVLPEVFKDAGFATAGLIVNGYLTARWGYKRGWDAFHNYMTDHGRLGFDAYGKDLDWGRKKGVRAVKSECITRDAAEWILSLGDKPFFLYIQAIDPHHPYRPPREFWEPYVPFKVGRTLPLDPNATGAFADGYNAGTRKFTDVQWEFFKALYYGSVSYSDFYFGKFMDFLKERGLLDDTLIMASADHGEGFLEHGALGHGTLSLYDEVIRVMWLTRYPVYIPKGRIIQTSVEAMDIGPTLLDAAGLPLPDGWQGSSRLPLLRGPEPLLPEPAFSTMSGDMMTVRLGRFKFIRFRYKTQKREIYDLAVDPGEKVNLVTSRPQLERYLLTYVDWFERTSRSWKRHKDGRIGDFRPSAAGTAAP